jgi:hypothetical protein
VVPADRVQVGELNVPPAASLVKLTVPVGLDPVTVAVQALESPATTPCGGQETLVVLATDVVLVIRDKVSENVWPTIMSRWLGSWPTRFPMAMVCGPRGRNAAVGGEPFFQPGGLSSQTVGADLTARQGIGETVTRSRAELLQLR